MPKQDINIAQPQEFQARRMWITAMRIDPDINPVGEGFFSPHDLSHAAIAGWLMGKGIRRFRVSGDTRPFGIEYQIADGDDTVHEAKPGDWIILSGNELHSMTADEFHAMYETYDAPQPAPKEMY